MFTVTKHFEFSYAHRLLGYPGRCGNIHGHTAKVDVTCSVDVLPESGMAIDFKILSKKIGSWIDETLDHNLILYKEDPVTKVLRESGEQIFELETPPSAEHLAKLIYMKTEEMGLPVTKVAFWESPTSVSTYSK